MDAVPLAAQQHWIDESYRILLPYKLRSLNLPRACRASSLVLGATFYRRGLHGCRDEDLFCAMLFSV